MTKSRTTSIKRLYMPTDAEIRKGKIREKTGKWLFLMIVASLFELIMFLNCIITSDEQDRMGIGLLCGLYLIVQWIYFFVFSIIGKRRMELEIIGFLLSAVSITITASISPSKLLMQVATTVVGIIVFAVMIWFLESINRIVVMRLPVAAVALALLALTLVLAEYTNGAKNWLYFGGISVQPSELVKVAFVFVGAATLEKLQNTKSIWKYIIFALACVGMLFLMTDFGTALIFFATFLIIAFLRSGDIKTLFLICAAGLLGVVFILLYKPYVAARFSTYRHIWENINEGGMQQTRTIIYSLSGGFFGVGIGNGKLRHIFAAAEDLVFGVVCEEFGILLAFAIVLTYAFLLIYAIRQAKFARSSFYAIAGVAAAGLLVFQACLNVFGVNDLIPMTGVTLPFVSRGGSSMLCSWGLLAFIKAMDLRTYPNVMKELYHQKQNLIRSAENE
ncbi:MAG TPA: FtsW/RodA/SpoVE family cell cycle protein [Clostridiales bacterium]|nr:FtsW/RodA/SpoVE family cell cycle protein [Clostridiales bacterium]